MKHPSYCCGFMRDIRDQTILLVRKQKPDWQRGRLNGIGGAIEENETPLNAMIREWHEEAGFDYRDWRLFARLNACGPTIHFFAASVGFIPSHASFNDRGEPLETVAWDSLAHRPDIIPNLRWLIPMAFADGTLPFALVTRTNEPRNVVAPYTDAA